MAYSELYWLISNNGIAVFVVIILLYDKFKTNGILAEALNNNTRAITRMESKLEFMKGGK